MGRTARVMVCLSVVTGSLLRILGAVALGHNWKTIRVYWKVMDLAGRSLFGACTPKIK